MKETGIIMSGNLPKLILDGIKTQTRRVIKPQPDLLYGIYGDIIQLYHNRRAEDDRVDIKANTNFTKRQLYGWERWQDILTNQIQGFWEKGFRGMVSISRLQDRGEGVFSCLLMPQQQKGNDVSSSANMYGFSRNATNKVNAGKALRWEPAKQQAIQSQMGNSIRELARQDISQQEQPSLQQSQLKNYKAREGTYTLGGKEQNRQQETYSQSLGDKPTFYIRNMPWSISQGLWVRETFVIENDMEYGYSEEELKRLGEDRPIKTEDGGYDWGIYHLIPHYRATEPEPHIVPGDSDDFDDKTRWSPSIFMPRWASRITLEITEVRVERLNQMTEADVTKEGVDNLVTFMLLWDRLNKKRGYEWKSDCWVWVITFKLCQ